MIDKDAFLKGLLPEEDVEVAAGTVRVRGLSRAEVLDLQKHANDLGVLECHILALGLVDPPLSFEEAEGYYAVAAAGDVDRIVEAISILSGLNKDAQKSGVPGLRGGQGA